MTDNDIVKALECCDDEEVLHWCTGCPYYDKENDFCQEDLHRDALDLINRQKAKIEYYKKNRDKCQEDAMFLAKKCDELQAEIERLKKENNHFADIGKMYSEIKAEAVKEFAEKVNNLTWYRINSQGKLVVGANSEIHIPLYKAEDIYNLLKEKVGGADG